MEVVVFGAGALGSLVGGLLARVHRVTLVGRDPHVTAVRRDGLRVVGACEAHVHPDATTDGTGLSADLALVTVKAFDARTAAETLATGEYDVVCSLSNGLTEETLAEVLGDRVLAGTATYGAELDEPGIVRCTGTGEIHVGEFADRGDGGDGEPTTPSDRAERVTAACREAGLHCTAAADVARRRWRKLAVNAGINAVTALARVRNGALVVREASDEGDDTDFEPPAGRVAARAAMETARVARAQGIDLADDDAIAAVREVAAATAANRSSTLQDVLAGDRTEVEAINGAVVARGEAADVATPVNRTLADLLRAWEVGRDDSTDDATRDDRTA
jgi:2-dehydropantoate 2-reductase